jgi:SnoaL-like domain
MMHAKLNIFLVLAITTIAAIPSCHEPNPVQPPREPNPAAAPPGGEAADRLAIKSLIDAYSHCADRRETQKQTDLFINDATIEVYDSEPGKTKPRAIIHGHTELAAGFATLRKYDVTMHFNGQSSIQLNGDQATGETYCLAHHLWMENGKRMLMVMGIRYYDTFARLNGRWLFARRQLIFDWVDKRPSSP